MLPPARVCADANRQKAAADLGHKPLQGIGYFKY